jgi:hypothetical protein
MIKTIFLIPERDNTAKRFAQPKWRELDQRLMVFGGRSVRYGVQGLWEAGGRLYSDRSRDYCQRP